MKTAIITVLALIILTQTLHTYYIFNIFSQLKGTLKIIQGLAFCAIFSVCIFIFVLEGMIWLAFAGAVLESAINIYYYFIEWWQDGYKQITKKGRARVRFWRQNWIKMIFALSIPAAIYILSHVLNNLE
jgi:hypothetical protein